MITCYVRYTLNLDEIDAFRKYAQLWIGLINRLGGEHHGYFLPSEDVRAKDHGRFSFPGMGSEGPDDVAVAVFSFPDWDVYEHYRREAGQHDDCKLATSIVEETQCFTGYERSFMSPVFAPSAPAPSETRSGRVGEPVCIRKGTPSDRDAIVAFDAVAGFEPARVELIGRALESPDCLVAEREGQVIGYVVLEYTFYERGFVSMLYVAEGARRGGVGRALLEAAASRCTTPQLFTSTNQSNRPMQELLASLGYVPSGIIVNLDPGDPELVYCLELSRSTA